MIRVASPRAIPSEFKFWAPKTNPSSSGGGNLSIKNSAADKSSSGPAKGEVNLDNITSSSRGKDPAGPTTPNGNPPANNKVNPLKPANGHSNNNKTIIGLGISTIALWVGSAISYFTNIITPNETVKSTLGSFFLAAGILTGVIGTAGVLQTNGTDVARIHH